MNVVLGLFYNAARASDCTTENQRVGCLMKIKLDRIETEAVLATKTGKLAGIRARHLPPPKTSLDNYL
jgi:hypothetical protein